MIKKIIPVFTLLFAIVSLTNCGLVPSEYRGKYSDPQSGTTLVFNGSSGEFVGSRGKKFEMDMHEIDFKRVAQGNPGIFVTTPKEDENAMDVYWVIPNATSKKSAEGFIWFEAEVLYTQLNTKIEKEAQALKLFHCTDGTVMLDVPTERWQIGCPAGPSYYHMVRVED